MPLSDEEQVKIAQLAVSLKEMVDRVIPVIRKV
jgi:hypothetical protein